VPGVLFSNRKIDAADPGIEDLAPTALSLFGVHPRPRGWKGSRCYDGENVTQTRHFPG
jgi:hypothetical protein